MSFGLRLRDYPKDEIDRRVECAADIVQLEGMLDRMLDELSGGQRQRVAIARAIVREPEVFLMDDPLASLDAKLRVHMRTEVQRLHKELDTTIIDVTHDHAEAMTMSDRIAVLDTGELQQIAPPLVCYNEPVNLFVADFIGPTSMNFVNGEVTEYGFTSEDFDVAFDPSEMGVDVGDRVTLGIRPEDVYLEEFGGNLDEPSGALTAWTAVLEPMGDEIFVYHRTDENLEEADHAMGEEGTQDQLLMSVDPDSEIETDQQVSVVLDRCNVYLFDTESGEAITHTVVGSDVGEASDTGARAEGDN